MENNQRRFSDQEDAGNQYIQNNRQGETNPENRQGSQRDSESFSQDDDFTIGNENYDNISTGDYTGSESSSTLYQDSLNGSQSNFGDASEMDMDDETREAYSQEHLNTREMRNSEDMNSRGKSGSNDGDNEEDNMRWSNTGL